MHPVIRTIGKVLRLVGISSPEDSEAKKSRLNDPPSWKTGKSQVREAATIKTTPDD